MAIHRLDIPAVGFNPKIEYYRISVPVGSELDFVSHFRDLPGVIFAEPDYRASAQGDVTPDDPEFPTQWNLNAIAAPGAWEFETGSSNTIIAFLDSGIQLNHPDLASRLWINSDELANNGIDDDGNGKIDDVNGWHYYYEWTGTDYQLAENGDVSDDFGHGTHVAGIAAAATNNQIGVSGIDWSARIMPVKVLDEYGSGYYSDIAFGIIYAVDNGADVINLSLGGENTSTTLQAAVDYAISQGAVIVAAAGNTGEGVLFPASYEPVLAVTAVNKEDRRPSFANFGSELDLAAPGTEILSTWFRTNYFSRNGTSMSAAHVSGAAGLLLARDNSLTPEEVISILQDTADDLYTPGYDPLSGYGRLNLQRAVIRLSDHPDLWVKISPPSASVDYAQPSDFIVSYGNLGGGVAPSTTLTLSLPANMHSPGLNSTSLGNITPHSGPYTQTLTIYPELAGTDFVITASISTPITETLLSDNIAQAAISVNYRLLFPYLPR